MNQQSNHIIKISDFTVYPTARYITDGDKSAEEYFESILSLFLNEHESDLITIDFDGTWGYASSFKSELAIRLAKKYPEEDILSLKNRIKLISNDEPGLINRFWEEFQESKNNEVR